MSEDSETVADKIKQKRLAQELAQSQHDKARQQMKDEKKAQQKAELEEYETALKEQALAEAQYQKELEAYNKAQLEYEREIAKHEAELKANEDAIKQREQAKQNQLDEINQRYDTQIKTIEQQRDEALAKKYQSYWGEGGERLTGKSRTQFNIEYSRVAKEFNNKIRMLGSERSFETQSVHAHYSGLPQWAITKATRLHAKYKYVPKAFQHGQTITSTAQQYEESFLARQEFESRSSITTARSNAVKERERFEHIAREFEAQKKEADKLSPPPPPTKEPLKQAIGKKQPEVLDSVQFKKKFGLYTDYEKPPSIHGTSAEKSKQAVKTFEETQAQQRELYWKITNAREGSEALAIKTRYQEANAYVGTPQTLLYKGGVVERQGVLIEKKLLDKFPDDKFESYNPIANARETLTETTIETTRTPDGKAIPTLELLDDDGNVIDKPTNAQLYQVAKFMLEQKVSMPSDSDQILSKYWEENADAINKIEKQNTGEANTLIDTSKDSFTSGVLGHPEEIYITLYNLFNPNNPLQLKKPTLESQAVGDLVEAGKYYADPSSYENYGKEPPKSEALKTVKEKSKSPEGIAWLVGTVGTSIAVAGATVLLPPLAIAKYGKYIIQPRNLRKAEKIAEKYFSKEQDEKFLAQTLREKYPKMPEKVVKRTIEIMTEQKPIDQRVSKSVRQSAKELLEAEKKDVKEQIKTAYPELPAKQVEQQANKIIKRDIPPSETPPYTVEAVNERTFLVTGGTETDPVKTPAMIVRFGKNARTSLFQVTEEGEIVRASNLMVRGTQKHKREIITSQSMQAQKKEARIVQKEFSEFKKGKSLIEASKAKKMQAETVKEIGKDKQGKTIVKGTEAEPIPAQDVTVYTVNKEIRDVLESPQGQNYLSPIGMIKDVLTKDLKKYPKPVIESTEQAKVKTGTQLVETKAEDPVKSFIRDVESLPEPDSLLKVKSSKSFKPDDDIITSVKGSAGGYGRAKAISDDIKTSMSKTEIEQVKPKTDSLKTTAKEIAKSETGSNYYAIEGKAIGIATQAGKESIVNREAFSEISKLVQSQQEVTGLKSKLEINTKLQNLLKDKNILIDTQNTKTKDKNLFNPRYSLIVSGTQKYKGTLIPKYILRLRDDLTTTTKPPPTRTPPRTPPPRRPPLIIIPGETVTKKQNRQTRKGKLAFTAWNVDIEEPGKYLEGQELRVTRTAKAWRELDRQQRTGSSRKKSRKKVSTYDDDYYDDPFPTKKTKGKRRKFKFF